MKACNPLHDIWVGFALAAINELRMNDFGDPADFADLMVGRMIEKCGSIMLDREGEMGLFVGNSGEK